MLFPADLGELIEANHPARVVSMVIDRIETGPLLSKYKGGGCSSYHPRMLLKVLVYGYLCNIFSSRRLEAALKESVPMMWLSGMQHPDHNTINRFRSERLKGVVKEVFAGVVGLLVESGLVSIKQAYVDGTKIEANASRYSFVWAKSIETNRAKMAAQIQELWDYAESVAGEELKDKRPESFLPMDPAAVAHTVGQIDATLRAGGKKVPAKIRQKVRYGLETWPAKVQEYNQKEAILAGRGSYSKTDHDATFMRMKEDHMGNGQLKPGYNLQISTSDQIVVNYSVHQDCVDSPTMPAHLARHEQIHGRLPEEVVADAGYGSEENYALLEAKGAEAYVKYNMFDKERDTRPKLHPFRVEGLHYNPLTDTLTCPMGQQMRRIGSGQEKTTTGYVRTLARYKAANCQNCPLNGACHKQKGDRVVELSHEARRLRGLAAERLESEKGVAHRKKRACDVESAFGNIKHNKGFRRFMLRGIDKVEIEAALIVIAHNIQKIAS